MTARVLRQMANEKSAGFLHALVRPLHSPVQSWLRYVVYRQRYFFRFTVIGFLSILLELVWINDLAPAAWPWASKVLIGFCFGLLFSFAMNVMFNFQVRRQYFLRTLAWFGVVSTVSFAANMAAVTWLKSALGEGYGLARLISAGILYIGFYAVHRRYTFDQARNFGLALYATEEEDVERAYQRVGPNCDHLHIDLIDSSMKEDAAPVNLNRIREARALWSRVPICLHVMSLHPARWVESAWDHVDWFLFHVQSTDDLMELIYACRSRHKKVGVVWQQGIPARDLFPYLPHVDYLMILGIPEPGRSGQKMSAEALAAGAVFESMRARYGYTLMFDGGVTVDNVANIPARYIVSASAVLASDHPQRAAFRLRTASLYEGT